MSTRRSRLTRAVALPLAVLGLMSGCGSGLSSDHLAASIGQTFANLYVLQQREQGNPTATPADLHSRATCQKGTQADSQHGAGNDWLCQITFLVAGPSTPVTARYNVTLQTDGCYAADGDGPASVNGSRTIVDAGQERRRNPLFLINSCFQVTS